MMSGTRRKRLGDRRAKTRFEIVGQLWGALETVEPLALRDIGLGGALLETPLDLPLDSIQRVRLAQGDQVTEFQARVRHVTPVDPFAPGTRFYVGLEFVTVPPAAQAHIERVMATYAAPPGAALEVSS